MKDKYVHLIVAQKQDDQDGLVRVIAAYSSDKTAKETLCDFREEYIAKMRKLICADYPAQNAKEYDILGRAIQGCSQISILDDGSVYNGYGYINGKNIRAAYIAGQLIDGAIKVLEKEREGE